MSEPVWKCRGRCGRDLPRAGFCEECAPRQAELAAIDFADLPAEVRAAIREVMPDLPTRAERDAARRQARAKRAAALALIEREPEPDDRRVPSLSARDARDMARACISFDEYWRVEAERFAAELYPIGDVFQHVHELAARP